MENEELAKKSSQGKEIGLKEPLNYPNGELKPSKGDQKVSGYNGGDEDEIMEKVIKKFSKQ